MPANVSNLRRRPGARIVPAGAPAHHRWGERIAANARQALAGIARVCGARTSEDSSLIRERRPGRLPANAAGNGTGKSIETTRKPFHPSPANGGKEPSPDAPLPSAGAAMRHRWGELITSDGMPTLVGIMRACGASKDQVNYLLRDSRSGGVSALDPLGQVEMWLRTQLRDPEYCRRVLAGTLQCLQALRSHAPLRLPKEPLNGMPAPDECAEPPEWRQFQGHSVLLWKDREGLHWAAAGNPLSLGLWRWLMGKTGIQESNTWLRCLGNELEKNRPVAQVELQPDGPTAIGGKERVISWLMESRMKGGVSDIHIRVQRTDDKPVGQVTYRHMGMCVKELPDIPLEQFLAAQRYLLVLAKRTDSETLYVPYDRQIQVDLPTGDVFNGRLSMVPYYWDPEDPSVAWYSTVIRILSGKQEAKTLDRVVGPEDIDRARALLDVDAGMVIVSGPTGSGKTTLLASLLSAAYIERPGQRLLTVEDPVEIPISGSVQFAVEERQSLDFDMILRSLLRQDPDILLVGEVRDAEVAEIASRLAVSGHTVFTTCHASYAATVAMRMQSLRMHPDHLAATLRWSTSQRLLTGCCPDCSPRETPAGRRSNVHGALFDTIRRVTGIVELPEVVFAQPDADPACRRCQGHYAPRRLILETLHWSSLPPRATARPENEWWNEALSAGRLVPMWYRAVARLLRREVSVGAFIEKFASEPPHWGLIDEANTSRLRERVLREAGLRP